MTRMTVSRSSAEEDGSVTVDARGVRLGAAAVAVGYAGLAIAALGAPASSPALETLAFGVAATATLAFSLERRAAKTAASLTAGAVWLHAVGIVSLAAPSVARAMIPALVAASGLAIVFRSLVPRSPPGARSVGPAAPDAVAGAASAGSLGSSPA